MSRIFLFLNVLWLAFQSLRFDVSLLLLILEAVCQVLVPDLKISINLGCSNLFLPQFAFQQRLSCHSRYFSNFLDPKF